ncbi:MAG: class I SAM-dependent methyltransferase [Myxococcales bacterium]|nr:class I SAM-dependent methyltransferase [Myxococcales bacterium]
MKERAPPQSALGLAAQEEQWPRGVVSFLPERDGEAPGFDPENLTAIAELEHNFWFEHRRGVILDCLERHANRDHRGLECGSGTGNMAAFLRDHGFDVQPSDIDRRGAEHVLARGFTRVLLLDLRVVPFRERYDWVGMFDVLEHIDDDQLALHNVAEMLRPGGLVLLTVPAHRLLWSRFDELNYHRRRYSKRTLAGLLKHTGFDVLELRFIFSFLYGPMLVRRLLSPATGGAPTTDEFHRAARTGSAGHWVARRLCAGERRALRHGLAPPLGGSLLVVGRKR